MVTLHDLVRISDYEWEIPQSFRADMRVPVRLFATRRLLEAVMSDKSLEQAVNAATLPGLVGHVVVMPDMHQGYGFPIGGVAATRLPDGVISPGGIGYDINCLAGDSLVLHAHGYTRRIDEMAQDWPEARLACFQLASHRPDSARPVRWFGQPAHAPAMRLVTESGRTVTATADHPFWTEDGMQALERLLPGERVAVYTFDGVPYEPPAAEVLVSQEQMEAYLQSLGKGQAGNALSQIVVQLKRRDLLPLRLDSAAVPYLIKLLGFVFGDGSLRFDRHTGKGKLAFYGEAQDMEDLRDDIARLGFRPSRVWARRRSHAIQTTYAAYEFEHTEHWITVNSTALAALLSCLGAPLGNKARQDYGLPGWLEAAPGWYRRLFLAAFFGAELSAPQAVSGHGCNLAAAVLSQNKRQGYEASGQAFLEGIARWLADFGVQASPVARRAEQTNADGSRSIRLRLVISAEPENLARLWGTIGYEYNRKRRALAAAAVQYLAYKARHIAARQAVADEAKALASAGLPAQQIYARLSSPVTNRRFIERSLYEGRQSPPRVGAGFIPFDEFRVEVRRGLGESGMTWERIARIDVADYSGLVYDFTVDHADHNFISNGFVVSNCGVRLLGSQVAYEKAVPYMDDLASALNQHCPSGVGEKGAVRMSEAELEQVCREGARWALKQGMASEADLRRTEESGRVEGADPGKVSKRARERGRPQLGSLGSGNHFIEIDLVEQIFDPQAAACMGLELGCLAVQIHCGSRGFGHQICTDYVEEFQSAVRRYNIHLPDRELVCAPLNSPEGQNYLGAMRCAANFAFANRQVLAHGARQAFEEVLAGKVKNWHLHQVYDICHNMGKIEVHLIDGENMKVCVHRKGATRAFGPGAPGLPDEYKAIGQPVLVPGSMGTASWVLVGTEASMERSFGSSCHGAGRVMSRHEAKRNVRGDQLRSKLEADGIHVRAGSMAGLAEEAPQAYKDVNQVVEAVTGGGIARQVARLRPLAVIKG
ncbi:MAG TPA: intein-containing RctB family protein [Anaerolineales bacterium]|nr:intein-containing RctB family protein [Anaerolineales bacterium]